MNHATPAGPSSPPLNAAKFTAIQGKLNTILSKKKFRRLMSWGIFASNMKRYMATPIGVATLQFKKKLTTEYDACIRRGIQGINLCSIQKGNTELMESLTTVALLKCFALQKPGKPLPTSPILKELGNAVKGYWTGATLNPFPIPPIPAPGSIQNIVVSQNICVSPGHG